MSWRSWLGTAGLYLLAATVVTWPLAIQLTSHLGALEGAGDPFLNLWILGWGMQAWIADPVAVVAGRAFDANIFFPARASLTYSDHLLLQSLALSPIYSLTGNVVLCYNILLIASIAASGAAMHLFVRSLTGSAPAAMVAGLAWACWPYRTAHLLHLQLQALYFLPLALWALHRLVGARRGRDAAALALFAALQAISSVYYGVMTAIALAVSVLALAVSTGQWRSRRLWSLMGIAAVCGTLLIAPVAIPYWRAQQREGFGRNLFEAAAHAGSLQSYTQVPPDNLLYGRTGLLLPRAPEPGERDRRHVEHQMFPGLVLICLAIVGAWRGWRSDSRPVVASAAALVLSGVVLSLGPEGLRSVYAAVADLVFGFQAIRAPARFAVVAMAGLCVLAGVGMASARWRSTTTALVTVAMMAEYVNAPLPLVAAPPRSTPSGAWLKDAAGPGAVVYLPFSLDRDNTPYMVQSLEHMRPIVNGYSGQRPAFFTTLVDALSDPASLDARATLKEIGVRFAVSARPIAGAGDAISPYVERAHLADGVVYELVWTEAAEAALDAAAGDEPPAPGPAPFASGETATYEARWLSGPLEVSAGTIVLSVGTPTSADRSAAPGADWAFEATASTAPWVSRFFEANDRFRTLADDEIKPLVHLRALREGRRILDRVFVYDAADHRVRAGETIDAARGPSALVLPLANGARDAVTALWYLRSMPLAPGLSMDVPINDAGRGMTLHLTVGDRETLATPQGPTEALRVSPRLVERVPRRPPVEATLWFSADERRVPLAVEVTAQFGRVRLQLVDYRP